ncbi:MAG: hypothetical protein K6C34_01040 [Alphaproteobacteria bacterium]|nr:hypothetical protein [Alphaproteobacteria bacterium]
MKTSKYLLSAAIVAMFACGIMIEESFATANTPPLEKDDEDGSNRAAALAQVLEDQWIPANLLQRVSPELLADLNVFFTTGNLGTNIFLNPDVPIAGVGQRANTALVRHILTEYNINELNLRGLSSVANLPEVLAILPESSIHTLRLTDHFIDATNIQTILSALPSSIKHLHLNANGLRDADMQVVAQHLPPSLMTLNLAANNMTAVGVETILRALPLTVTELNIDHNSKVRMTPQIAQLLSSKGALKSLHMYQNCIGQDGAQLLFSSLPPNLISLYLGANDLDDAGAQAIAPLLRNCKLEVLDLAMNDIESTGARAIAAELPNCKLRNLCLYGNRIGVLGAQEIARALPTAGNDGAKFTLDLSHSGIGDEGAQEIAATLPMSELRILILDGADIGAAGVRALARQLSHSNIEVLNLWNNRGMGDAGATALARAIVESGLNERPLHSVLLVNCGIGAEGARALYIAICLNSHITELEGIEGYSFPDLNSPDKIVEAAISMGLIDETQKEKARGILEAHDREIARIKARRQAEQEENDDAE